MEKVYFEIPSPKKIAEFTFDLRGTLAVLKQKAAVKLDLELKKELLYAKSLNPKLKTN